MKIKILSLLLIFTFIFTGCQVALPETTETNTITSTSTGDSNLTVHFIDVGQGDSMLIQSGGENMLIDCGEFEQANAVDEYLKKYNVDNFKYVIGTHPHSDHIGGLDKIIENYPVETLIMPDATNNAPFFEFVLEAIQESGLKVTKPVVGTKYSLGEAEFTILSPTKDYEELNNASVGIRLVCGNTAFVMCGDAEKDSEKDIIANAENLKCNVLKLNHHGSTTSNSADFLDATAPQYAIASCGLDNSYGHPHREVVQDMKDRGITLLRTYEEGDIVFVSDGNTVTLAQDDIPANQKTPASEQNNADNSGISNTYTLNTNSKKFHLPSCGGISQISQKNRQTYNGTRQSLLDMGYDPCGSCNP